MNVDVVDLDHVAIRVTDLEAALEFYHDHLGMAIRDHDRYADGEVPYVALVAGGRHIHLVPADEAVDAPDGTGSTPGEAQETFQGADGEPSRFDVGGEHLCLLVRSDRVDSRAELESLLAELRAAGVTVEEGEPRKRYGAYGRAWAAYVRDPDGRRVELKIH